MSEYLKWYYYCPASLMGDFGYKTVKYLKTEEIELTCNEFINLTVSQILFDSCCCCSSDNFFFVLMLFWFLF